MHLVKSFFPVVNSLSLIVMLNKVLCPRFLDVNKWTDEEHGTPLPNFSKLFEKACLPCSLSICTVYLFFFSFLFLSAYFSSFCILAALSVEVIYWTEPCHCASTRSHFFVHWDLINWVIHSCKPY